TESAFLVVFSVFDDCFLRSHGAEEVAFLLHEDWLLPTEVAPVEPVPARPGTDLTHDTQAVWLLFFRAYDPISRGADRGGGCRIDGTRLPDLVRHLATADLGTWPFELWLLRSQLLADEDAPASEERAFLA